MNHATCLSSVELQNSLLQPQPVLSKLYITTKDYSTVENVVDLKIVIFPSVDKNDDNSDTEDDNNYRSNEQ
jgi:hypothetical protein